MKMTARLKCAHECGISSDLRQRPRPSGTLFCQHCGILMSRSEGRYFPGRGYPVMTIAPIEKVCGDCEHILIYGTPDLIAAAKDRHNQPIQEPSK